MMGEETVQIPKEGFCTPTELDHVQENEAADPKSVSIAFLNRQMFCSLLGSKDYLRASYSFLTPPENSVTVLQLSIKISPEKTSCIWSSPVERTHLTVLGSTDVLVTLFKNTKMSCSLQKSYLSDPLNFFRSCQPDEVSADSSGDSFEPREETFTNGKVVGWPVVIRFHSSSALRMFFAAFQEAFEISNVHESHLDVSDSATLTSYFQYYAKMSNQMNMLQDRLRTKTYYNAILCNEKCFHMKRVMDVGGGSGILSFFASQAGAATTYVIEASSAALIAVELAKHNTRPGSFIKVIQSTLEKLDLFSDLDGEKVDILVSEPIGTFIFNERMIESYLFARDVFLKPGGQMYPNRCRLFLAPFCDPVLYNDFTHRPSFWSEQNFYGVDLSSVYQKAVDELFRQPVVDYIDPNHLLNTEWHCETFDFETLPRDALKTIVIRYNFPIMTPSLIHGIAGWFDVHFDAGQHPVEFSTSPLAPPTHWYQIRFLFRVPIAVNPGQLVSGTLRMIANSQQSYYITADALIEGTHIYTSTAVIDLKDPDYRYYTSPHNLYIPTVKQQTNQTSTSFTQYPSHEKGITRDQDFDDKAPDVPLNG